MELSVNVASRMIMFMIILLSVSMALYSLIFRESAALVIISFWAGTFTSLLVGKEA